MFKFVPDPELPGFRVKIPSEAPPSFRVDRDDESRPIWLDAPRLALNELLTPKFPPPLPPQQETPPPLMPRPVPPPSPDWFLKADPLGLPPGVLEVPKRLRIRPPAIEPPSGQWRWLLPYPLPRDE